MHVRRRRPRALKGVAAVACGLSVVAAVAAGNATNAFEAPPVVVTATRVERAAEAVPAQVTVLTAEQLRATGARDVVDALRDLGGLHVRTLGGNPAQAEVVMRGFGENAHGRVLVLRDGQRLNSPDMAGVNWLQIPLAAVERIEILKGGHSALHGDHAVAGVINIVTRPPAGDRARLAAQAGSYGTFAGSGALTRGDERARAAAGIDWQTSDGFRHNGGYDALNARAAVEHRLGESIRADVAAAYDRFDNGLPGYLTREQMKSDPRQTFTPDDEVATDNYNARLALQWLPAPDQSLDAALTLNRKETENDLPSWLSFVDTTIDSLALALKHNVEGTFLGRPDRLLSGVDFHFDRLEAERFADAARGSRLLDATIDKQSLGAYLQNETDLGERLTLSLGGRLERARYAADVRAPGGRLLVDDSTTHRVGACAAGLLFRPRENVKLYARADGVYRLPFIDEQVSYYGYGSDRFYDELDPETGFGGELGGTLRLAEEWQVELALFRLKMHDEIAYNPLTGANDNMDDTRRQGAEAALGWERRGLGGLTLRYTFTDAVICNGPDDGADVPLAPRHCAGLLARAELPFDMNLLATLHIVGSQVLGSDYDNNAERLGSYATLDLALRYAPRRLPDLSLLVGVDNVLDKQYAGAAYEGFSGTGYYPAPGRTWKTALACAF